MKRLLLLAATTMCTAALVACSDALLGPAASTDRAALFDEVWHEFDLHYSFFDVKHVNWDSLGAFYRPVAIVAPTDEKFAEQVATMLDALHDVHVSLTPGAAASTLGYVSRFDTISTWLSMSVVFQQYVTNPVPTAGGHMHYGMVAPSVGYVRIGSFLGSGWDGEIDEVIDSLHAATSLIVDVRNNSGGDIGLAVAIAGRFTAKTRLYGYVKLRNGPAHSDFTDFIGENVIPSGTAAFRHPVFVLTNRRDFSSAEDFVLAMRTIPRVTVIGDTTAGASGGPITRELSNGWDYELSEWIEFTPAKAMFEGVGLAPDEYVAASAGDAARGVDAALARAVALARKP